MVYQSPCFGGRISSSSTVPVYSQPLANRAITARTQPAQLFSPRRGYVRRLAWNANGPVLTLTQRKFSA